MVFERLVAEHGEPPVAKEPKSQTKRKASSEAADFLRSKGFFRSLGKVESIS